MARYFDALTNSEALTLFLRDESFVMISCGWIPSIISRGGCYERCFECTDISIRGGNTQLIFGRSLYGSLPGSW